jgi:hypothetical protein
MIEGIEIFERIKVYGKQIPSDTTILLVLHKLKTPEKISNFTDASNLIVREMRFTFNHDDTECSEFAPMGLNYKNNYQAQCNLIGADFLTLWYYFASSSWFVAVMGHLEIPNQSDMSQDIVKHVNAFKKTGAYVRDSKYIDDKNNLVRFKEYREAIEFISQFVSITSESSKTNQEMKELLIQRDNILKELAKWDRGDPIRICRFCMSVFNVRTSSDNWKSCGSPDCKRAYIRTNRQNNHPKRGWIHDFTAQQPCMGMCGSDRKQLNSNRVCFGCYEPFS